LTSASSIDAGVRRRVAVVVQRYGDGLLGGAESHARRLVQALVQRHEVTLLTSCARDATTWAQHYAPGESFEDGVRVQRFAHPPRNEGGRAKVPRRHKLRFLLRALLDRLGGPRVPEPVGDDVLDGHEFLRRQGPTCAGLVAALRTGDWDAVVFVTALYHPTAEGLPVCRAPAVLLPLLHDEKAMALPWYHRVFAGARETLWNTEAERRLGRRLYGAHAQTGQVVAIPIEVVHPGPERVAAARAAFGVPERYLIYVGRIEKGKGCAELLAAWQAVAARAPGCALVFVGKGNMVVPASAQVRSTGFVSAAERDALVAGAAALVMPSRYESLSAVLLEALALGVPVLANGDCEPLADHVAASGAGTTYHGRRELRAGLLQALARPADERRRLGDAGRRYVEERYALARVEAAWLDAIERVAAAR
jgi:glycosyltransferase involved in cell wall biosynthesis